MFLIAGIAWFLNRVLPFRICPICAGVAGTWLWMLAGLLFGFISTSNFQLPISILMGGSVVGIAYQIGKNKMLFIPVGFIAAYGILSQEWILFVLAFVVMIFIALFSIFPRKKENNVKKIVEELEKKMKKCC